MNSDVLSTIISEDQVSEPLPWRGYKGDTADKDMEFTIQDTLSSNLEKMKETIRNNVGLNKLRENKIPHTFTLFYDDFDEQLRNGSFKDEISKLILNENVDLRNLTDTYDER